MQRVNGVNYLDGAGARRMCAEHASETGIVLCFRFPPRRAFGLAPGPEWMIVRVLVDDDDPIVTGFINPEPRWVSLDPGDHIVAVMPFKEDRPLVEGRFHLEATSPVIVDIFPRRRRFLLGDFIGPKLSFEFAGIPS